MIDLYESFPHSWLITGFVTRLTRRVPLVEQELPTLPEHMNSPPVFSGDRIARTLVQCVVLCGSLFVLLFFFSFDYCAVCPSNCGYWLPHLYLQIILMGDTAQIYNAFIGWPNHKLWEVPNKHTTSSFDGTTR